MLQTYEEKRKPAKQVSTTRLKVDILLNAIHVHNMKYKTNPTFEELLESDYLKSLEKQLANLKPFEIDEWGNKIVYVKKDKGYLLYSRGPNGIDEKGKGDDISPW